MAETTDTTESVTIDGITEGEKYRLQKPDFKPHINGGTNPGYRHNGELIPWGSKVIAHANDQAGEIYQEDGKIYVHCRIIAELRSGANKQFHKVSTS